MNRQSQSGVALVVTLIMLSVVTVTAVAFLAVTRRERASVSAAIEQTESRYLAETALARARGEVASRILGATNRMAYDYFVSTNFVNANLNLAQLDQLAAGNLVGFNNEIFTNATTYIFPDGRPVFNINIPSERDRYRATLANLYFDPRPPVFADVSRSTLVPPEFRYYLDLNRNGSNDPNGLQRIFDGRRNLLETNFLWGDPEWIGLLENPGFPHSGTNRFVGRYAYVVIPASRTLDINYIHNAAKNPVRGGFAYSRNQGAGGYENNLAAYFGDLNTNIWNSPFPGSVDFYDYSPQPNFDGQGRAFQDADILFRARRGIPRQLTALDFYRRAVPFNRDSIDNYGDGPVLNSVNSFLRPQDFLGGVNDDLPSKFWPGTDNTNQINDITRIVDGTLEGQNPLNIGLVRRLNGTVDGQGRPLFSSYDNNTFYRLLSSLGTDSPDARYQSVTGPFAQMNRRAKLNLNYANEGNPKLSTPLSASVETFRDWTPIQWFTNAVQRLLADEFGSSLPEVEELSRDAEQWFAHGAPVYRRSVVNGVTNVWRYDAQMHRLLQLAANIYDATHYHGNARPGNPRPDLPSVFRPILYRVMSNNVSEVRLAGFQEVVGDVGANPPLVVAADTAIASEWIDIDFPEQLLRLPQLPAVLSFLENPQSNPVPIFNVYGMPWIVGVKKGHPTFQEGFWQSHMKVTRRIRVLKNQRATDALATPGLRPWDDPVRFTAQAQYRYDFVNTLGMEAWNAYQTIANTTRMRVRAVNDVQFAVYEQTNPFNPLSTRLVLLQTNVVTTNIVVNPGNWQPQLFLAAINTNLFTSFVYDHLNGAAFPAGTTNLGYVDIRARTPFLNVAMTNRLRYWIEDESGVAGSQGRLIDFVNLKSVIYETNILRLLMFPGQPADPLNALTGVRMHQLWDTNILAGVNGAVTRGASLQMDVSLGSDVLGNQILVDDRFWRDAPGLRPSGQQREFEKDGLFYFLYRQRRRPDTEFSTEFLTTFGGREIQLGYNPSPDIYLTDRRQANDPLVHFTMDDLAPGQLAHAAPEGYTEIVLPGLARFASNAQGGGFSVTETMMTNHLGNRPKFLRVAAPWGSNSDLGSAVPPARSPLSTAFDVAYKDPLVVRPDDWNFPTNKVASLGALGRIHRGTPWQTIYMKGKIPAEGSGQIFDRYQSTKSWAAWAGNRATRPEKDWLIFDHFTAAPNDNAARGLLSINQTNIAAWSAVLAGVPFFSNTNLATQDTLQSRFLRPSSVEIRRIVQSINTTRSMMPGGYFQRLGDVLATPALSVGNILGAQQGLAIVPYTSLIFQTAATNGVSPLLSYFDDTLNDVRVSDEIVEQIPQQILSLLNGGMSEEPRVIVYAFGQSLKPAPNSIVTRPGPFFGLSTNYVVTGEFATKTVVRFDGPPIPNLLQAVIEDHQILSPEN